MTWTPPPGNALDLALASGYTPPAGDGVNLAIGMEDSGQGNLLEGHDSTALSGLVTALGGIALAELDDAGVIAGIIPCLGSAGVLETDDALVGIGAAEWTFPAGGMAASEAGDGVVATGLVEATYPIGEITGAEQGDALAAVGQVHITGTVARAEGDDAASAVGEVDPISGTIITGEGDDAGSATARVGMTGAAELAEAGDVASLAGLVMIHGAHLAQEGDDLPDFMGQITLDPLFAPLNGVEGDDGIDAHGSGYAGQVQQLLATLTLDGVAIPMLAAFITLSRENFAWTGEVTLADADDLERLPIDAEVHLTIGEESWRLLVDGNRSKVRGGERIKATVSLISTSAVHDLPRSGKDAWTWDAPTLASQVASEALGEAVAWELVDWTIKGGRLDVADVTPMAVVTQLARVVGGVVETLPAGGVRVRHRFPVAVPEWPGATVSHVVTADADTLVREIARQQQAKRVNRVIVRDLKLAGGQIDVTLDHRVDGLNVGRKDFFPGETAHLLGLCNAGVVINEITVSAGVLTAGAEQTWSEEDETLVFANQDAVRLNHPAISLDGWEWLGQDLGDLILAPDHRTVTVAAAGVGVARVSYTVTAPSWAWVIPDDLGDFFATYPMLLHVDATFDPASVGGGVLALRDGGELPADNDVVEPLLTDDDAMAERGRAELDGSEAFATWTVTTPFRPGVMPGQMVAIQGEETWQGMVIGVKHTVDGVKILTQWEVLRHATQE